MCYLWCTPNASTMLEIRIYCTLVGSPMRIRWNAWIVRWVEKVLLLTWWRCTDHASTFGYWPYLADVSMHSNCIDRRSPGYNLEITVNGDDILSRCIWHASMNLWVTLGHILSWILSMHLNASVDLLGLAWDYWPGYRRCTWHASISTDSHIHTSYCTVSRYVPHTSSGTRWWLILWIRKTGSTAVCILPWRMLMMRRLVLWFAHRTSVAAGSPCDDQLGRTLRSMSESSVSRWNTLGQPLVSKLLCNRKSTWSGWKTSNTFH